MNAIVIDLSQPSLSAATKANLYAFFRYLKHHAQAEFAESSRLARWHTTVPHPWFNGVLSKQPPTGDEAQVIQETLDYFKSRGIGNFTWWLELGLEAADWAAQLLPYGFHYDDHTPGMAVALQDLPAGVIHPGGFVVQAVDNLETLELWIRTFVRGYEIPEVIGPVFFELMAGLGFHLPVRAYLGYLDGAPVATSLLFLSAGVAGIYNVATVPAARGQGLGAAITLAPLQEAQHMGYRAGVLQSSDMGFSVYRRLGFQTVCAIDHFHWMAAADGR